MRPNYKPTYVSINFTKRKVYIYKCLPFLNNTKKENSYTFIYKAKKKEEKSLYFIQM